MKSRTRTLTVVFTDMTGYSKAFSEAKFEDRRLLQEMFETDVKPILTRRGGRIIKAIGDSYMCNFENATDAVRACLDLMEASTGDASPKYRASVATGDVEEVENDAFGDAVILSARINAIAESDQVWFSESTRLCMNPNEIPWEPQGRHKFRNVPGDHDIYRAIPAHAAYLPEAVTRAARANQVVVWNAGAPTPQVPPGAHLLLDGFRPRSPALNQALESLPVFDPAHIWLCTYNISPVEREDWLQNGRGLIIAVPQALRAALDKARSKVNAGGDTLILDNAASVGELVLSGIALPSVPHSEVVAGYTYDLSPDGRWLTRADRPLLRVEVREGGASLTVHTPGVLLNGRIAALNQTVSLDAGLEVTAPGLQLRYVAIGRDGYLGALFGDTQVRQTVNLGTSVEIGREPDNPGMRTPDRQSQDNLRWCVGLRAGRVRERGFTLDKALTGRHHAKVIFEGLGRALVSAIHDTLPTFVLQEDGNFIRLPPPQPNQLGQPAGVGDTLVLGTCTISLRHAGP